MSIELLDTAPTTPAEMALFRSMSIESRLVWCPLRDHRQIDIVVCSRLQTDYRRRCLRADRGHCCKSVDSSASEKMQRARKESD